MKDEDAMRQAFGLALRTLRKRRGYSQEKLALEGVNRGHVSDMECGRIDPKLTMLFHLCDLLDIQFIVLAREIERNYVRLTNKNDSQ